MMGNTMWNGLSWGSGLLEATGYLFMIEWFLYNFVTILIAITVLALIISFLLIYRKHKKYGLGPRIVSIFYIDGLNLHTIANILFFVALIIAILGLFNNWYTVSADIDTEVFQTQEMLDIIRLDGINGMNIYMPSQYGSIPMGSAVFPFAYIFLIGFIFMFISTVGIYKSTKLGRKYILKGIRFILIVVVLIISLMLIGNLVGSGPSEGSTSGIGGLFKEISSNPIGGTYTIPASEYGLESGSIAFQWNLGFGMTLILISGIIFLVAGILNIVDGKEFFKPKIPKGKKITETPKPQPQKQEIEQKQEKEVKQEKPKNEESKKVKEQFCPSCGTKLKENTNFCHECGGKV